MGRPGWIMPKVGTTRIRKGGLQVQTHMLPVLALPIQEVGTGTRTRGATLLTDMIRLDLVTVLLVNRYLAAWTSQVMMTHAALGITGDKRSAPEMLYTIR